MQKDVIIKYLPHTTTQQELAKIRSEHKDDTTLILIVSGQESLLENLQTLINID